LRKNLEEFFKVGGLRGGTVKRRKVQKRRYEGAKYKFFSVQTPWEPTKFREKSASDVLLEKRLAKGASEGIPPGRKGGGY